MVKSPVNSGSAVSQTIARSLSIPWVHLPLLFIEPESLAYQCRIALQFQPNLPVNNAIFTLSKESLVMPNKKHVIISGTAQRALLLLIVILLGILLSIATAQAGVRIEKSPFTKTIQKKKTHSYSCRELMQKHRSSSNTVVKINSRRPKWR